MSKPLVNHALILDADYLVYQAMSAAEIETQWSDDVWTLECDHVKAWNILIGSVQTIVAKRKAWATSKIVMCFTDDHNWRKDVLPTYKANRKATRKPTGYRAFVNKVMQYPEWESFLRPNLEGDDCMGILGTRPSLVGAKTSTLVSCDKDFNTIPCEFFWLTTGEIKTITEEDADRWHMLQTIMGDVTDGYSGIKGMGKDTALAFLEEPYKFVQVEKTFKSGARKGQTVMERKKVEKEPEDSLWDCMVTLAAKADMTEEDLLKQAQVARILRASDYDFKNKEPILWTPSKSS
ncbi:putative exonuclease [Vibrio phage JSF30]|uniref:Putative exonuclease n=1 Tax=Vibrio phage JSF30 TaxID=1983607 RepID=A0A2D0Z4R0_9CAUD|nr:putative exonuclease [Vibrio phage JSF30]